MRVYDWEWSTTDDTIVVEYEFDAGDPGVMYYADGSGEPPTPPSVDIVRFKYKGVDITDLIEALVEADVLDDIEMEIVDHERDILTDY